LTDPDTETTRDADIARAAAAAAGRRLVELRDGPEQGKALGAAGDRTSHRTIVTELARLAPGDVVLSEEGNDTAAVRAQADRVWIVDPLDGTREYSEPGREDWAVHVALWTRTGPDGAGTLAAGAVALPARGEVLDTARPPAVPLRHPGPLRVAVSRTRPPGIALALAQELGAELVPLGSAGAKTAAVWRGEVDAYVHAGGQYEWDSAAPVAVARAAGLHTARLDGTALHYNRPDPYLPDLFVCRAEFAVALVEALGAPTGRPRTERNNP
jgi:3'(2'), 5'-bisphosphate nucleotidase